MTLFLNFLAVATVVAAIAILVIGPRREPDDVVAACDAYRAQMSGIGELSGPPPPAPPAVTFLGERFSPVAMPVDGGEMFVCRANFPGMCSACRRGFGQGARIVMVVEDGRRRRAHESCVWR